ncbi:MAG: hypothetical protein NTU97_00725 [Candidatus Magasanikbacteria bacterium]|nr:hypothetical protein [Candidatus Magasanikbacteria bacterium]
MSRKEKKSWGLEDLLSVVGFVFELLRVVVNALRKRDGTIEHLRRLLKEPDLVDQIFDLIVVKPVEVVKSAFSALVIYIQPSHAELQRRFDLVVSDFAHANFKPINRCHDVSHATREVGFEYFLMDHSDSYEEVLVKMNRQNLRPALYEEGLFFAGKYPDEQRAAPIIILGSIWTYPDGCRRLACLGGGENSKRSLFLLGIDGYTFGEHYRFLAVRK